MRETKDGYRASEVPSHDLLGGLLLAGTTAFVLLTGVFERGWDECTAEARIAWAAGGLGVISLLACMILAAWRRKPWIEVDREGRIVRWGSDTRETDEAAVARFQVEQLQGTRLYRLMAVCPDSTRVAMLPEWEGPDPHRLEGMARRLNELTRD